MMTYCHCRCACADLSVVECVNGTAALGDRNVHVRCELKARPEVTSLRWIVDDNGTSVSESEVVNEYWTLLMVRLPLTIDLNMTRSTWPNTDGVPFAGRRRGGV